MVLEAVSSHELLSFIMCTDSNISSTPYSCSCNNDSNSDANRPEINGSCSSVPHPQPRPLPETTSSAAVQGRKKRRRKPKVCKNKEEAESQRMTHIAVERNRRKQMNEHLAVLRSLMPASYVQRGDQASIVGGAIEFVKELEHMLQSLEAKKYAVLQKGRNDDDDDDDEDHTKHPFAQFFANPQFSCSPGQKQLGNKYTSCKEAIADIEVTLIETHASIRILSHGRVRQLSKIVAAFHTLFLTVLHINLTSLDSLVLYSISAKVEEGCQLNSADDIAGAVHHMLRIIEEEALSYHVVNSS